MLTPRQRSILELFRQAEDERLPPPTMRSIAEQLDLSPGTVTDHMKRMVRDHWLEQPEGHNKYRLTERAQKALENIRAREERRDRKKRRQKEQSGE